TLTSVHLNHLSLSVRMVIRSDFMAGPPPKSEAETLSSQVLGVGAWVCAASPQGASAAMTSAGRTYRALFIEDLLVGLWGLRQNRLEAAGWECQRLVLRGERGRCSSRIRSSALPVPWPRAVL